MSHTPEIPHLEQRLAALEQSAIYARRAGASKRSDWVVLSVVCVVALIGQSAWLWHALAHLRENSSKEHLFWVVCHEEASLAERTRAFLDLVELGNTEWRAAKLNGLDLTGVELAGAFLTEVNLDGCKLTRANLSGAILHRSTLKSTDLAEANLTGAQLLKADIGGRSILKGADFRFADMRGAYLDEAHAAGARFGRTNLMGANLVMADLSGADLREANLSGAKLSVVSLRQANLAGAVLSNADFDKPDFADANWWRTVGLPPQTVHQFNEKFQPSSAAPPQLREDYQRWLSEQGQRP